MPWPIYVSGSRQAVWLLVVCLSSLLGFEPLPALDTDETQPLQGDAASVFDLTMPVEEETDDEQDIPPTQPDTENNGGADPPKVLAYHDQLGACANDFRKLITYVMPFSQAFLWNDGKK